MNLIPPTDRVVLIPGPPEEREVIRDIFEMYGLSPPTSPQCSMSVLHGNSSEPKGF
jgi:hypothetical protein